MTSVVGDFNEKWGTNLQIIEVEQTDTLLEEVQVHNFIYLRTFITDGTKEAYWTSKLTPTEYSVDCIEFAYLPVVHPGFEIDSTVQYWQGEIIRHSNINFYEAGWDRSLYGIED